jgi:putative flippase GtrA
VSPGLSRLIRYGISGGASAASHFGIGFVLAEGLAVRPVVASTTGFLASILVSYVLQHAWVFRSATRHTVAGGRFLTVTGVAFVLNATVLWIGTEILSAPFVLVQGVALIAIPFVNYVLNSRWTFRVT